MLCLRVVPSLWFLVGRPAFPRPLHSIISLGGPRDACGRGVRAEAAGRRTKSHRSLSSFVCALQPVPLFASFTPPMSIDQLPSAVVGLCLSWLALAESAWAIRVCRAWRTAAADGPRSRVGAICLNPTKPLPPTAYGIDEEWSAILDCILASPLRRRMGELALPWTALLTQSSQRRYLAAIASAMPQLERLVVSLHPSLLPLSSFPLPAQLRELKLQVRAMVDNMEANEQKLDVALAATLDVIADTVPQLRALTVHVGAKGSYRFLGPCSMEPILRMKHLERLYIELRWSHLGPAESRMIRALGCEMPALRTLIIDSAEWDYAEEWKSCRKGQVHGPPAWRPPALALLVSGPRDLCVLEYIGRVHTSVTRAAWDELCRVIPTLTQRYDPQPGRVAD